MANRQMTSQLLRHQAGAGLDRILSGCVVFILIDARVFSLTFYDANSHLWGEH